ncbi:hypothetical protein L598_000100002710 [Mesorhizobium sp. J18]|nr:hypothetical protein L598_000100002710 [Mesorhizobium sp. J18]
MRGLLGGGATVMDIFACSARARGADRRTGSDYAVALSQTLMPATAYARAARLSA